MNEEDLIALKNFLKFFSEYLAIEVNSSHDSAHRMEDLLKCNEEFAPIERVQFSINMPNQIITLFERNCGKNPFLFKHLIVTLFENKPIDELVLSMDDLEKRQLITEDKKHLDFRYYSNRKNFKQKIEVDMFLTDIFSLSENQKLYLKSQMTEILKKRFIDIINSCCEKLLLINDQSEITKKFLSSNLCNNFFDQQIRSFPLFILGETFMKEYSVLSKDYLPFDDMVESFLTLYIQYFEFYECIDKQEKYQKNSNELVHELSTIGFSEDLRKKLKEFYESQFTVFLKEDIEGLIEKNNLEDLWLISVEVFNRNCLQKKSIEDESDSGGEEKTLEIKQKNTDSSNFYVFCDCSMIKPAIGGAAALSSGSLIVPFFLRKVGLSSYKEITPFNRKKLFLVGLSGGTVGYAYSFYKKNNTKIRSTSSNLYKKLTNKNKDDQKEN